MSEFLFWVHYPFMSANIIFVSLHGKAEAVGAANTLSPLKIEHEKGEFNFCETFQIKMKVDT